jgi:hypothetical protein
MMTGDEFKTAMALVKEQAPDFETEEDELNRVFKEVTGQSVKVSGVKLSIDNLVTRVF